MDTAKEFISTLFGLLVAYLLPGLLAITSVAFFYEPIEKQLLTVTGATAPSGISVFLFLAAVLAGVQLNVVRWAIYVKLVGKKHALSPKAMAALGHPKRAEQYRLFVEQILRPQANRHIVVRIG